MKAILRIGFLALAMMLTLTVPANAGPLEDGLAAFEREDYATALRLWRPLAERGNAKAQTVLGIMYEVGQGVPQDYAEAVNWYRMAAEQGHAEAQYNLGAMYAEGQSVPQDHAEAAKWYRMAAEQGHTNAQTNLGIMYAYGEGVQQDDAEAEKWYRKAAFDRGDHTTAQSQTISIEAAEFLVFLNDIEGNEQQVFQSNLVPLIPDRVCFGWRIRLAGAEGLVRFKEVYSLPGEPEFSSGENDEFSTIKIAKDRATAITEMFIPLEDGWIENNWCVEDGDPEGRYSMEVHINGQFAKRFDFEVRDVSDTSEDWLNLQPR